MEKTLLYQMLAKSAIPFLDVQFHIETLYEFPENEWFSPSNKGSQAYGICSHLSDMYLLQIRRTPIWQDGSFRGMNVEFRYSKDLNYRN